MKITAIYIRVSTEAQREEGYSIEAQTEALTAYCTAKGWKTYELYIDGGYSGSSLERPAIQRLIHDVKNSRIERVLVYKLDRLSRSQKDTLYLIEDILNPHEVDFISLNESMDTGSPMGRLMLGILSAFAQLERENIRERTRMGMAERVKAGYWMGGGKIPYGYDYDAEQGILIPNGDADTVARMYRWYLQGYSPAEIAELTGFRYDRQITQILKRITNTGKIPFRGRIYPGRHKAIISEEIYTKTMLEMERRSGSNWNMEGNLLTGLIYCGHCGAKMRYQKWGQRGHKLVCYSRQGSKSYLVKDPDCPQEHIWADEVEDAVVEDMFLFPASYQHRSRKQSDTENMERTLEAERLKAEKRLSRLYRLYADAENAEDDALQTEIRRVQEECKKIREKQQWEKEQRLLSRENTEKIEKIGNLREIWPQMTAAERRRLLHQVIRRITITDENVQIDYDIL